jgi:hypothetical protein
MLDYLYSERCTREVKLIVSVVTCAVIYYCSNIEKLSTELTLLCLMLGFMIIGLLLPLIYQNRAKRFE